MVKIYNDNVHYVIWKAQARNKFIELVGVKNIEKNSCSLNIEIESEEQKEG